MDDAKPTCCICGEAYDPAVPYGSLCVNVERMEGEPPVIDTAHALIVAGCCSSPCLGTLWERLEAALPNAWVEGAAASVDALRKAQASRDRGDGAHG